MLQQSTSHKTVISLNDLPFFGETINTSSKKLFLIFNLVNEAKNWESVEDLIEFCSNKGVDKDTLFIEPCPKCELTIRLKGALGLVEENSLQAIITYYRAYITFAILFGANPFLGKKFFEQVYIDNEWEKKYFIKNKEFIFSKDGNNSPAAFYQDFTIKEWENKNWTSLKQRFTDFYQFSLSPLNEGIVNYGHQIITQCYNLYSAVKNSECRYRMVNQSGSFYNLYDSKYIISPELEVIGEIRKDNRTGSLEIKFQNNGRKVFVVLKDGNQGTPPETLALNKIAKMEFKNYNWNFETF